MMFDVFFAVENKSALIKSTGVLFIFYPHKEINIVPPTLLNVVFMVSLASESLLLFREYGQGYLLGFYDKEVFIC